MSDSSDDTTKNDGYSEMMAAVYSLQASHEVTSELERAKCNIEQMVDYLPVSFAIVSDTGKIYRSNHSLAKQFKMDVEQIIGLDITQLFREEGREIFNEKMLQVGQDSAADCSVEFELSIDNHGDDKEYYWNIRPYGEISGDFLCLYQVIGQDISLVKEFERKLSNIFSNIPLGIMTIKEEGIVDGPYSCFTEVLLGTKTIQQESLFDIFFDRCKANMSPKELDGLSQLKTAIGQEEFWFDSIKPMFPQEVFLAKSESNTSGEGRWIEVSYNPVVHGEIVEKILIILEDKTQIVLARNEIEEKNQIENAMASRLIEVQKCDEFLLEASTSEFREHLKRLRPGDYYIYDLREIVGILHSIKGIARTGGFTILKDMVHELEEKIQAKMKQDEAYPHQDLFHELDMVKLEIEQILVLAQAVNGGDSNGHHHSMPLDRFVKLVDERVCQALSFVEAHTSGQEGKKLKEELAQILNFADPTECSLTQYEPTILLRAEATAKAVGKVVEFTFDWGDITVKHDDLAGIGEIIMHILNNGIDHGIEDADKRLAVGKNSVGHIGIKAAVNQDGSIQFSIKDDGRGLDADKILKSAVDKKVVSEQEAASLNRAEILHLIFNAGFSTRSEATDISGRGVGLDSVEQSLARLQGSKVQVSSEKSKGTCFQFSIYNPK